MIIFTGSYRPNELLIELSETRFMLELYILQSALVVKMGSFDRLHLTYENAINHYLCLFAYYKI
jgi:hypothetical protein